MTGNEPYYPLDFYFGNIRDVKMGVNGEINFNANFSPLNDAGSILEVLGVFSKKFRNPSVTPLLCSADSLKKADQEHQLKK